MKYITKVKLKDKLFKIYKLEVIDVPIFKDLHQEILDTLKGEDKEFNSSYNYVRLKRNLKGKSIIYMVYCNKELIAYGFVFSLTNKAAPYWLNNCKIDKSDRRLVAEMVGAGVLPDFRGYGLQDYLFKLREKYLKKIKYKYAVCSVHPKNIYSYNNLVKNNYVLISLGKNKYNHDRFYFKKEIN